MLEAGAPDAELTAEYNLVKGMLTEEDAVEERGEPPAHCGEADEDERDWVASWRHLVELRELALTPLR